jgi:excalibur calcium-binding domain-containing protein
MRVLLVLAMVVSGCGGATTPPAQFAEAPTERLEATDAPLATEAATTASPAATQKPAAKATAKPTPKPTPKPTRKPTPRPTKRPASYYKPPGWDGYSDVNCPDFDTHAHAQSFFKGTGGSRSNDPYGLDRDHDGIACESLP